MRHIVFEDNDSYPIALLIKNSSFNKSELKNHYIEPMVQEGISISDVAAVTLEYNSKGKVPVSFIKEYLGELLPALKSIGTKYLYCADANYFKVLTGQRKAEPHLGYVLPCKIKDYEDLQVILGVNHKSLIYNENNYPKLQLSLKTLIDTVKGSYQEPGTNIIHYAEYPETTEEIKEALTRLAQYDELSCDIETFSLRFNEAGIATITFCWSEHEGIAFPVDYVPVSGEEGIFGKQIDHQGKKALLRAFFEAYKGTFKWHNCTYDTKVLIYELWMDHMQDVQGLLYGLDILHKKIHDTKIITYLATNNTGGNELGLKDLAHEFAGNYAQDNIKDIRKIPLDQLLEYNLVDGLSTNYVFNKYYPKMVQDNQEDIYTQLMMPSQKTITQIELTGMPMDMDEVLNARNKLEAIKQENTAVFQNHPVIQQLEDIMTEEEWKKDFETRKFKAKNPDKIKPKDKSKFPRKVFNPNSNPQLQKLFYEQMGLPVIDKTATKMPATGGDTIKKLLNHTENQDYKDIMNAIKRYSEAEKILSTFIPAFENSIQKNDGHFYLHGSFNLGGTVSGRLSSSDPNLQNIPSGSTFGKLIKKCFKAPKGWLFIGADFNSLEDYISALTTKDPNKLKVYQEGYDGHCLRSFSYFPERLPGITPDVDSINSIKKKFPKVRQDSKGPTFALTYQGTWITLVKNLGFTEETAKKIEAAYHELYKVSDQWVADKLQEASERGYVEVAFGLRLRTPLLAKTFRNTSKTPYEAEAEGRTAGNALGQSYGLLTNRSMNEFMEKVRNSPYRYQILPVAMIHDANYFLVKDSMDAVKFVNDELIKSMQWQELPEIQHDTVKLGAELSIFYPSWAEELSLPNFIDKEKIKQLCIEHMQNLKDAA